MSEQPITTDSNDVTENDTDPSEAERAMRAAALQYASFLSTQDTPLIEFLQKAVSIEEYISSGSVPKKDKDN